MRAMWPTGQGGPRQDPEWPGSARLCGRWRLPRPPGLAPASCRTSEGLKLYAGRLMSFCSGCHGLLAPGHCVLEASDDSAPGYMILPFLLDLLPTEHRQAECARSPSMQSRRRPGVPYLPRGSRDTGNAVLALPAPPRPRKQGQGWNLWAL